MSLSSPETLALVVAFAVAAAPAGAADWSWQPTVDQEVFYDSNIVLGPVIEEEVEAYMLAPKVNLRGRGGNWNANLNTELIFTRLSNQLYDSDDQVIDLSLERFNEKQRFRLDTEFSRESTRTLAPELDFVQAATRSEIRSVRPSYTRTLNQRNSLTVAGNWLDAEFAADRFNDYEQYGFDVTWSRLLGERLSLQVGAYNSRFESGEPPFNLNSDTIGLNVGFTRQFDEQLTGSVTIGSRQVDTTTRTIFIVFPITIEDESSGFTASADLQYEGDTWSGTVSIARSLSPNGFVGELLESDRIRLRYERQLRPRLFFNFNVQLVSEDSLGDDSDFERERLLVSPGIRWQFAERWSLNTRLRYRTRDTDSSSSVDDAEATSVSFMVRYSHPRSSW